MRNVTTILLSDESSSWPDAAAMAAWAILAASEVEETKGHESTQLALGG